MVTIHCISQKSFQSNHTHTFTIYGEGLDVVVQPGQVTLSTTDTKLSWGPVQSTAAGDFGSRHLKVKAHLKAVDSASKPTGLVRRFLNWLRALFGIKSPRDPTGDLTITITDPTQTTTLATQGFEVTYTS